MRSSPDVGVWVVNVTRSGGLRGLRQFDPDDKRAAARFPFIGTPDIRSRKTPEDQQGDEFMAVS
jgi:hypothetical protein